jgi:glycine/D-amino acid oxidase-like deaminating enzyme
MQETASVVIVGGGVMGASLAFHLGERGCRDAVLLERRSIASGPTGYSSALLRQHYSIEIYARLAHESFLFYRQFRERVGGDCGFVPCGLGVVAGPEDRDAARQAVEMQRRVGIETELVAPEALRDIFGGDLRIDDLGTGAWERASGYADPVATTTSFARRARALGVRVREDSPVVEILAERGRVTGVRTASGTIASPTVVVAAGPWTAALVRPLGVELPITAGRPQVALLGPPPPRRPRPILLDFVQLCYFRPEVDDQLFVGVRSMAGMAGDVDPDNFKPSIDADAVERAVSVSVHRFPGLEHAEARGGYAAIYDLTPDLHFVIDRPGAVEGLVVGAGFSGHGFKHAPMIGRLLAELAVDGKTTSLDLAPFSLDRFRTSAVPGAQGPGDRSPHLLRGRYSRWPF